MILCGQSHQGTFYDEGSVVREAYFTVGWLFTPGQTTTLPDRF